MITFEWYDKEMSDEDVVLFKKEVAYDLENKMKSMRQEEKLEFIREEIEKCRGTREIPKMRMIITYLLNNWSKEDFEKLGLLRKTDKYPSFY